MADKKRFEIFAGFLVKRFGSCRVYDVAGGMGRLNEELTRRGCEVTTFDGRHKRLPVNYAQRDFLIDEPCLCDLVVGLHPDGATRVIVQFALKHQIPFAVVPCCSDNSMSYKPWLRHLQELAEAGGFTVELVDMPLQGRARVLLGRPRR